jgi:hypothetical protein
VRESIGFAFVQRAHPKGHFYLRDQVYGYWRKVLSIRMYNSVLEVFLELKIRDIKRFKIVVEIKARKDLRTGDRSLFILLFLDLLFNLDLFLCDFQSQILDLHQ